MNPVHEAHEFPVLVAHRDGYVVDARPGELQYTALLCNRQRVFPVNHFFALGSPMRPSALDKKSFSIASCPILAWSSFISGSFSECLPLSKTSEAFSRRSFFHSAIWLGWTSKRSASSTNV